MKFHEGILNSFWVTEQTRPYRKIYNFQFQKAITPKLRNPELRFLRSARHLMLLYICVKFHENISNFFWVTERTRFCDRQTDGWTDDQGKNNMSPNPMEGDIIKRLSDLPTLIFFGTSFFFLGLIWCNVVFVHNKRKKYEGCSGSSWNLVIKCSNIYIIVSFF